MSALVLFLGMKVFCVINLYLFRYNIGKGGDMVVDCVGQSVVRLKLRLDNLDLLIRIPQKLRSPSPHFSILQLLLFEFEFSNTYIDASLPYVIYTPPVLIFIIYLLSFPTFLSFLSTSHSLFFPFLPTNYFYI